MKTSNYFVFLLVTLISFLGTLMLVSGLGGYAYLLEMFILMAFAVIAFLVFYGFNMNTFWANLMATGMFALYLLNLLLIYFLRDVGLLYTGTLIIVIIGFYLAAFGRKKTFEPYQVAAEIEESKKFEEAFEKAAGEKKPRVVVEDLKPKKRAVKKAGKVAKKAAEKKPAKKVSKKKAAKKKPLKKKTSKKK